MLRHFLLWNMPSTRFSEDPGTMWWVQKAELQKMHLRMALWLKNMSLLPKNL